MSVTVRDRLKRCRVFHKREEILTLELLSRGPLKYHHNSRVGRGKYAKGHNSNKYDKSEKLIVRAQLLSFRFNTYYES